MRTQRIIDRFDEYMAYKHLNDNKVTVQLGLSNGVIGKSRKEGRDLSDRVIEQILNFYTDLNGEWLKTGHGEMLVSIAGKNAQVIKNNNGTTINGDGAHIHSPAPSDVVNRMQDQIDELIHQNGTLLKVIDRLTSKL
ncbi:MAG: hypothetical protein II851_00260 [Bacteroidales bacterium]|nr:hypothetical protein [Bacteroidales bacterium]